MEILNSFSQDFESNNITADFIQQLSYPDFVGFINQWNVLPGAHTTLSKWIVYGGISSHSKILQVACTTGFQSREVSRRTGCEIKAFDLSSYAIRSAIFNRDFYQPEVNVDYFCADGLTFATEEKFSHVMVGAGLRFFKDPQMAFDRCISYLEDGGMLISSPFYIIKPIPSELIRRAQLVFGITPTLEGYKDIMQSYGTLECLYEDNNILIPETEVELAKYCEATIVRACSLYGINCSELYDAMYSRLYEVKVTSNLLRLYQGYSVLVSRYDSKIFPNRYIELF